MHLKSKHLITYRLFGFTLVELIIVITLLAILAMISFLSFSGYSANSRDSVRLTDLSNIGKGLTLFQARFGVYPFPDNKIVITASGTTIGHQGYASDQVLSIIGINPTGGRDSLDNTPYTYSTNSTQSKYQLLGFLESNDSLALHSQIIHAVNATSIDYSNRILVTRGDSIGILFSSGSMKPAQDTDSTVDIMTTNTGFTMQFDQYEKLSGTGYILRGGAAGGGLVGYWNFDETSGTNVSDITENNNSGTLSGPILPSWSAGKIGNSIDFLTNSGKTSANGGFINFGYLKNLIVSSEGTPHTVTAWIYINHPVDYTSGHRQWMLLLGSANTGGHHWLIGGPDGPTQFGIWQGSQINFNPKIGQWFFVAIRFDGMKLTGFENTNMMNSGDNAASVTKTFKLRDSSLIVGKNVEYAFDGKMDELRIYNRVLTNSEILALYNATK